MLADQAKDVTASDTVYEKIGEAMLLFLEDRAAGRPAHPEMSIVELPIQTHLVARRCFSMLQTIDEARDALGSIELPPRESLRE